MVKTIKTKKKSIRDKNSREKNIEITKEVLKCLMASGFVVMSFALPNLPQIFSFFGYKTPKERYKIKRAIRELEKNNFVKIYKKGEDDIVEITEKGKKKVLKYKLDELKISRPKKWDKKWRLILYDIPEKHKKGRNALKIKLGDMEFYPIQKSVFLCPFDCKNEVDFVSEFFDVRKFIYYFVVEKLDTKNIDYLKKYYNLI
jgi:DNA-binding transcriptional regulator PaaX